jgi:hypothetical protein
MLNFPLANTPALLCLLILLLLFLSRPGSAVGQTSPATSHITLASGYSSFLYEHGRAAPDVAHANFDVFNSSPKTVRLKIRRVELATDQRTSAVEKFTVSVCRKQPDGGTSCVDHKPNRSAMIGPNTSSSLTINFPTSQLRLSSREGRRKLRIECWVRGRRLTAETEIRIKRMEPWRRAGQFVEPDSRPASLLPRTLIARQLTRPPGRPSVLVKRKYSWNGRIDIVTRNRAAPRRAQAC